MNEAILVLSHQLLSMAEPIKDLINNKGYTCFILSSASEKTDKPQWSLDTKYVHVTNQLHLNQIDIDNFLETYSKDFIFKGCICVWDGYRELMSYANKIFGANDIGQEIVTQLRDKLVMRTKLREAGLSSVSCQLLNEQVFNKIISPENYFIKPRIGLASMGTFSAQSLKNYSQLETLWVNAIEDKNYDGVFSRDNGFIIEDFIKGTECSFEVSLNNSQLDVLAVHEKLDVLQETYSILEGACVCPPSSLSKEQVDIGKDLLNEVMKTLGVHTGVYHVEMKYDTKNHWEVIEINPRIGGAYIVDSTKIHCGASLLEIWLMSIIGQPINREYQQMRTTFFRVFFGQPGRTLRKILRQSITPSVLQDKVLYKPFDTLPRVDREIFLGMALWDITGMPLSEQPAFFHQTQNYLITEYQA